MDGNIFRIHASDLNVAPVYLRREWFSGYVLLNPTLVLTTYGHVLPGMQEGAAERMERLLAARE